MFEVVEIHRYGLAPADGKKQDRQRAQRGQVPKRIQTHAALPPGEIVTQETGRPSVRELVEGYARNQPRQHKQRQFPFHSAAPACAKTFIKDSANAASALRSISSEYRASSHSSRMKWPKT